MYYQGTPFVSYSEINESELSSFRLFFIKEDVKEPINGSLFKRLTQAGEVKLIIYSEATINNSLHSYHKENYTSIPYHVEQTIQERVIKTTTFQDGDIQGIRVFKYDEIWRTKYENWYNEKYQLIEYRELFYEGENRVPSKEKMFFAESWTTLEESYD